MLTCFGLRDYPFKTASNEAENHLEILETLNGFIKQGKIKHIGLSNETPWGTMKYLQASEQYNLPKPVTIQNSYSMIHRGYEVWNERSFYERKYWFVSLFSFSTRNFNW